MNLSSLKFTVALALAALAAAPASAASFAYDINGGTFSDGTTFGGSFTYDDVSNSITAFNVITNTGVLPAFTYTSATAASYNGGGVGPNNFILLANNGGRYFNFSFASSLSSGLAQSISTTNSYDCNNCGTFRRVTAGSILTTAAVPEPATWAMMLLGFGGIGMALRRRKPVLQIA